MAVRANNVPDRIDGDFSAMKIAICEKCGRKCGAAPDDATDIICFACNEKVERERYKSLKPGEREVKAGDVLIALRDDQCLVKGKRYMVFEDTPGQSAIKCEMSTEPR